jgi:RsiW-degrading membrane proteinase PrsW (M82 family)
METTHKLRDPLGEKEQGYSVVESLFGRVVFGLILSIPAFLEWVVSIPKQSPGPEYVVTLAMCIGASTFLWFMILRRYDRYTPISTRYYLFVLLAGGVMSTYPAGFFNGLFDTYFLDGRGFGEQLDTDLLLFVGPNEEFWKIIATVALTWKSSEIREPLDVVVASTAVGLGFAAVENITYLLNYGNHIIVIRTMFSVPMHLILAVIWGYGLAFVRFHPSLHRGLTTRLLPLYILSAVLHDFYNMTASDAGVFIPLILIYVTFLFVNAAVSDTTLYSDASKCTKCKAPLGKNTTHCTKCHTLRNTDILPTCPRCSANHLWTARYCHNCGHDLSSWKSLRRSVVRRLLPRRLRSFRSHQAA